jgi:glycerol-3-phosphate dehydrogenase
MPVDSTIVVLGAGINGAAVARELTLSGVNVIVVDDGDIAAGATAWSTRLIHGGLRYLEYGEIGLVRESLVERNRLVKLAAHLVRPLPFYLPVEGRWGGMWAAAARLAGCESLARAWQGRRGRGSWTVGVGLALYDLLAAGAGWPRHSLVRAGHARMPQIDAALFPRAAIYSDAQLLFPERFTVELLVDARGMAAAAGTRFDVCTHRRVQFGRDGTVTIGPPPHGGDPLVVRPDAVVNATGAWVDRTLDEFCKGTGARVSRRLIGGTKGSHLVVRNARLRSALADYGVYAEATDGRPIFVLPFGPELVLVGTTDIPFSGDPLAARTDETEISYLLTAVARLFPTAAVGRDHVQQHYCGVRPLPNVVDIDAGAGSRRSPAGVTRRHLLVRHDDAPCPLWSIVGGKLTTCRSLAETTAATVLGTLGVPVRSTSRERPLPGNCTGPSRDAAVLECRHGAERAGVPRDAVAAVAEHTVGLFGTRAVAIWRETGPVVDRAAVTRGALIRGVDLPAAAVEFCLREEWAVTLDDLIERRLMLAFHEQLSRETITDVADAVSRAGALAPERVTDAIDACVVRLEERYGRMVPPSSGEPNDHDRTSQGSQGSQS